MKNRWNKENLERIVKKSKTKKEVLIKLGLRSAGGNSRTLNKYLDLYKIDTSHLLNNWEIMVGNQRKKKIPMNEVLVENSAYSRHSLKNRLYSEGYKKRECEFCGQGEEWRGEKISLILDHINGVYNDNRIENLRILCPNCNATLPTHCGKNKSKKPNKKNTLNYNEILKYLKSNTKIQFLNEYGTFSNKKKLRDLETLKKLKNSDIDFGSFGWVKKASLVIGISENKAGSWLKRVDPEFYKNCYTKKK